MSSVRREVGIAVPSSACSVTAGGGRWWPTVRSAIVVGAAVHHPLRTVAASGPLRQPPPERSLVSGAPSICVKPVTETPSWTVSIGSHVLSLGRAVIDTLKWESARIPFRCTAGPRLTCHAHFPGIWSPLCKDDESPRPSSPPRLSAAAVAGTGGPAPWRPPRRAPPRRRLHVHSGCQPTPATSSHLGRRCRRNLGLAV
jgi:hypothetical protein